jgi:hypothetical protein
MNRSLSLFLASAVLAGLTAVPVAARAAWSRTIHAYACSETGQGAQNFYYCSFPSDAIDGTTSIGGNGATTIYTDFVASGGASWQLQACGESYNRSAGACGAAATGSASASQAFDISVPLWVGTGSRWDYFGVTITTNTTGAFSLIGVSAYGSP